MGKFFRSLYLLIIDQIRLDYLYVNYGVEFRSVPPRRSMRDRVVLHRRAALIAASTAALSPIICPAPAPAVPTELPAVVPLFLCGGAYCAAYELDKQPFRAVVDTGSPFMLVDGTCGTGDASRWGCYRGNGRDAGLTDTDEIYGGSDVGVEWRRGDFRFVQARVDEQQRFVAERADAVSPRPLPLSANVPNAVFGIVRKEVDKGGGGAVFLGLAKRRLPRIRPTLLEQTDIASLRFDFVKRRMELSRVPLIPPSDDALKLLDLRSRGAPVAVYAVKVQRLVVNGEVIKAPRPIVAIIDSGTTGISISDDLFDSGLLPAQWRDARIELGPTERGRGSTVALEASIRNRRPPSPGVPASPVPLSSEEYDEFPLVCTPVRVPWFAPGFARDSVCGGNDPASTQFAKQGGMPEDGEAVSCRRTLAETRALFADDLGPRAPHVLFVGLAFLWQRTLTIDLDTERMTII